MGPFFFWIKSALCSKKSKIKRWCNKIHPDASIQKISMDKDYVDENSFHFYFHLFNNKKAT